MYQTSRMSGWSRALAIVFGLFIISVGFTAIFFPGIIVGLVTILFSISFILLGLWALSMGISGQRVTVTSTQMPSRGNYQEGNAQKSAPT